MTYHIEPYAVKGLLVASTYDSCIPKRIETAVALTHAVIGSHVMNMSVLFGLRFWLSY
jgi:hypothetical protein